MAYLENIPKEAVDYGINKLLIVRDLSIDWKHRDTEIFLRNTDLLKDIEMDLLDICKIRSNQLRFIYHISRSVYKKLEPSYLVKTNLRYDIKNIHTYTQIYFDFSIFIESGKDIYNRLNKSNIVVYSDKVSEKNMIKFIVKNDIELPKHVRTVSKDELFKLNKDRIVSLFINNKLLSEKDKKLLWVLNYHLYEVNHNDYKYIKFKTDSNLTKGLLNEKISIN